MATQIEATHGLDPTIDGDDLADASSIRAIPSGPPVRQTRGPADSTSG
jgi:hypothetical protein